MSDTDTFTVTPELANLGAKKYERGVKNVFTLQISDGRMIVFVDKKKYDKFYLKNIQIKSNPSVKEFHIRTDGFEMLLKRNNLDILSPLRKRVEEACIGKQTATKIDQGRPKFKIDDHSRYSSPLMRSALDLKSSGPISRNRLESKLENKLQSPPRQGTTIERKVYTQSPLRSPLKALPIVDDPSIDSSCQRNNLAETWLPTTTVHKTYGRKRPIGALTSEKIPSTGLFDNVKSSETQESEDDIFSNFFSEVPKGNTKSIVTAEDYQHSELLSSQSTATPVKSDTKKMNLKQFDIFSFHCRSTAKSDESREVAAADPSASAQTSKNWETFSSVLNPSIHPLDSHKNARMRVSSPSIIERSDDIFISDGMRTPELPSRNRFASIVPPVSSSSSVPFLASDGLFSGVSSKPLFYGKEVAAHPPTFEGKYEGGIRNLGNTCYMSSILQALSSVRGLSANMQNPLWSTIYSHQNAPESSAASVEVDIITESADIEIGLLTPAAVSAGLDKKQPIQSENSLFSQLCNVLRLLEIKRNRTINNTDIQEYLSSDNTNRMIGGLLKLERKVSIDPMKFRTCFLERQTKYADFSQQDAQEFLSDLMNNLEDDMWNTIRNVWLQIKQFNYVSQQQKPLLARTTPSPASILSVPKTVAGKVNNEELETSSIQTVMQSFSDDLHDESNPIPRVVSDLNLMKETEVIINDSINQRFNREIDENAEQIKALLPSSLFFESQMQSVMTCVHCGYQHDPRFEAYRDFSLDILPFDDGDVARFSQVGPPPQIHIDELIQRYMQPESRDLRCPHCDIGQSVRLQKKLTSLAPVIVFHLKRFQYDRDFQQFRKIDSSVKFPSILSLRNSGLIRPDTNFSKLEAKAHIMQSASFRQVFDNKSSMSSPTIEEKFEACKSLAKQITKGAAPKGILAFRIQDDSEYQLTAVVRHYGLTIGAGHYICDVRNHKCTQQNDSNDCARWLRYNDAKVTALTEEEVLNEMDTPYLLFYQRVTK